MPLKFLKKCRQYNVTSKNLFVISVNHLLDTSTTVDCTISSESKGQECLDNVCQRLLIGQPELFGLRYMVKGKEDEMKWIDLDRSLSRQLEKYVAGTKIYLRVRHYVTNGVRYLSDEVTRYYCFLQLKSDIFEGKIACDIRTAILLALYCRQAEYDSYQGDKQSKDYLKKSLVLPKNLQGLCNDDNLLDCLILEVLQQNAGIQHLTQSKAEEMYIQCCQQLDGYGEERFQAKDTLGNDLQLGLAINGMVVNGGNGRQYFAWKDFNTVTIDKRTIKIEQNKGDSSIVGSFIFSEADMARYFWKLCITQHKFFKKYIDEDSPSVGDVDSTNCISGIDTSTGSTYAYDIGDSQENILIEQQRAIYSSSGVGNVLIDGAMSGSGANVGVVNPDYISGQSLQQQHHHMQHGLMMNSVNSAALMSSNISLTASHQSGGAGNGSYNNNHASNGALMHAHSGGALSPNWHSSKDYINDYASSQHLSNSILDTRLQSSSCLDLSNNNIHSSSSILSNNNHLLSTDAHERERLKAMLPTYRPAPDYETAVQLKYHNAPNTNELQHQMSNMHYAAAGVGMAGMALNPYSYAGSQPDVHNSGAAYSDGMHLAAPHRYPDVAQPAMHLSGAGLVASSNGHSAVNENLQRMQIIRSKPPPPYPVNRLSSSSTPDLAVASHRPLLCYRAYVSGSSPDLVSNRNFLGSQYQYGPSVSAVGGNNSVPNANTAVRGITVGPTSSGATMLHQYPYMSHMGHSQTYLPPHGTFENLNMIEEQPSIMSQLRQSAMSQAAAAAATSVNQAFEQNSPNTHAAVSNYHGGAAVSGVTAEPIYENVPLPQYVAQRNSEQHGSGSSVHGHAQEAMRYRTASIQSAPGSTAPIPATRHHKKQQQQQQHPLQQLSTPVPPLIRTPSESSAHEPDEISMNIKKFSNHAERAVSTELQFLDVTPAQRATRAASAAPTIGINSNNAATPPPRQHRASSTTTAAATELGTTKSSNAFLNISKSNTADLSTMSNSATANHCHDDSSVLQHQFSAMNLSSASTASAYNSTMDTSTSHSNSTNSSKESKRKKRWNILGRSKTPDKQKSATLGREKASSSSSALKAAKINMARDDMNLLHRWSSPKLQPISGQFSKDKLCQILDGKLNDSQLFMEFEAIPKRREMAQYECALLEENAIKNSDPNFLPYDDNRVRITPTMENRHGYVNASHISATVGTKQRFYIVAQSPHNELTTHIFWQCVWEADVYLVVQLSNELNYIPPNSNKRLEFGQFQVYQEFSQTTDRCITSKLRLYHIQSRRYRSVWHLNYTDWAEQNCPRDVNHFLDFLEELNSVRMASINEVPPGHNTNPPVLIHCLEGGGRSGVTLTADLLLYTLDHNEDLDIPRVIGQLRHQRDSIIPSLAQYKFIYSLLITYLKRTRLI